ncbi:MAG TPA: peptidoglycan DD-metalloendopeptidase family protein [Allosphingosinicella sp.]|jgi:septal ring factor EnvC (AmiA/AmiB activator)
MRRRLLLLPVLAMAAAGAWAAAGGEEAGAPQDLVTAKRQAEEARIRSERLEAAARSAGGAAEKARAEADAVAARIEAAEADITAGQARLRLIEDLRRAQRARLAEQQGPLIRLTGALQTLARRPPALALVQPGSLGELVHVRALLATSVPVIRARTAGVRAEVARGDELRREAALAVGALRRSEEDLRGRRMALAALEAQQRARSEGLAQSAISESDKALAFGEQARALAELQGTRAFQAQLRARLEQLAEPPARPVNAGAAAGAAAYRLPVQGRLLSGTGELSDAGVHARGLTLEASPESEVIAPAAGRVVFAGPFRRYGRVVILDHGGGLTTTITALGTLAVKAGDRVARGASLGRTGPTRATVSVELRRDGRPVAIAPLL